MHRILAGCCSTTSTELGCGASSWVSLANTLFLLALACCTRMDTFSSQSAIFSLSFTHPPTLLDTKQEQPRVAVSESFKRQQVED